MANEYIFENGQAVDVGSHGEHSYVYADGTPVPDTGKSTFVFEDGVGIGGGWLKFDDGASPGVDLNVSGAEFTIEHDGSATSGESVDAEFPYAYREVPLSYPIDVTFESISHTYNNIENNLHIQLVDEGAVGSERPHNSACINFINTEKQYSIGDSQDGQEETFVSIYDGSNIVDSVLDVGKPTNIRFQYDGSTATITIDGVSHTLSGSISGPLVPCIEVEDDDDVPDGEKLTLGGYTQA